MIEILQLVKWIIQHRRGRAFKDYSMAKICEELVECANKDAMLCVTDINNVVCGVVCFRVDKQKKEIFVYDILTTEPWVIREMVEYSLKKFPGYSLHGIKKQDIQRNFNDINKLLERL